MAKFRIVQREELFYVQSRKCFIWTYNSEVNFAHKGLRYRKDRHGIIGFSSFEDSKVYLNRVINSETRVIYEIET